MSSLGSGPRKTYVQAASARASGKVRYDDRRKQQFKREIV
jgi:hypothetical protein